MKYILLTLVTIFLIGCGGGGGVANSSEPTTPSDDIASTPINGDIADIGQN